MADSCFITNRRDLLIGMGGTVAVGALVSPALALEPDPACAAAKLAEAREAAVNGHSGPEEDYYESLIDDWMAAERALAKMKARSLPGVHAKMKRFVANEYWHQDETMTNVLLGRSILADLARMAGV